MTDQQLIELRERNAMRILQAQQALGEKWLLHPANQVKKLKQKRTRKNSTKTVVYNEMHQ